MFEIIDEQVALTGIFTVIGRAIVVSEDCYHEERNLKRYLTTFNLLSCFILFEFCLLFTEGGTDTVFSLQFGLQYYV